MQAKTEQLAQPKKLIKIDPDVHRKLTDLAQWGDTLSDIINMLIDEHNAKIKNQQRKENHKDR